MELEYYNFDGDDLDFGKYYLIRGKIQELIEYIFKKDNETDYHDILLTDWLQTNRQIVSYYRKVKNIQQQLGLFWQKVIPMMIPNIINLGVGHPSGLDWIRDDNYQQFIAEIKNRYNTDNASSRKSNFDKLCRFKKNNNTFTIIYGIINENTKNKKGKQEIIVHKYENIDYHILYLSGIYLFEYIFGRKHSDKIEMIKDEVKKFLT